MSVEIKQARLPNGLQLVGEVVPQRKSVALGFFVKTGARDEDSSLAGVSHFLEHMVFKGTQRRSALDITFALGNLGAQANAYTSEENTVFYSVVLPEYFPEMLELLSDMMRPALDRNEFDVEKKVILEEIALYQDRPHYYLFEHALRDYFGVHPAGNSVLGSCESISLLTRDQMQQYFERRYLPSNMVLVAAGAFNWEKFVEQAGRYCAPWIAGEAPRKADRYPAPSALNRAYAKKHLNQAHILFISEGASAQDPNRYALSVLASILGDASGSKLYWELIDAGVAESAGADNDERDGTGMFMAYASVEPGRLEQAADICRRVLTAREDFSDAELQRAKTRITARVVLAGELPMGRLMALGSEWNYRAEVESLSEVVRRIQAVDRKAISAALEDYPLDRWSEFRLLPE